MDEWNIPTNLVFPKSFPFGAAVASFQVEKKDDGRQTDWDTFIQNNPQKNIVKPGDVGPDWWDLTKARRDIDKIASLGTTMFRMSLEWDRIQPTPDAFNEAALHKYRYLIEYIKQKGMTPIVTINHFTLPQWLADIGSWENKQSVEAFSLYTEYVVTNLQNIPYWITLNEPNGLIFSGYLTDYFPPQKKSILATFRARANMLGANKHAYHIIKAHDSSAQVGIAYALMWFRPENKNDFLENWYTYIVDYINSTNWMVSTKDHSDFIGCNYYTGYYLDLDPLKWNLTNAKDSAGIPKVTLLGQTKRPGAYESDMGWPIVPDFFFSLLRNLYHSYHKPILITENGIADVNDKYRAFYILTHLVSVWKALDENIPILGYNYWAAIDNLEWLYGYSRHFGLVKLNAKTEERKLQHSSHLYKKILSEKSIDVRKLMNEFLPTEQQEKAHTLIHHILTAGKQTPRVQYSR